MEKKGIQSEATEKTFCFVQGIGGDHPSIDQGISRGQGPHTDLSFFSLPYFTGASALAFEYILKVTVDAACFEAKDIAPKRLC